MKKMVNKKGQDLSIGTLILIVLGIVLLVLLVLGFTMGWGNLWDRINIFAGGSTVGEFGSRCAILLSQGQAGKYEFCYQFKEIKINNNKEYANCLHDQVRDAYEGTAFDCDEDEIENAIKELCENLDANDRENTEINSRTCPGYFNEIYNADGTIKEPEETFDELCTESAPENFERKVKTAEEDGSCPKEGENIGVKVTDLEIESENEDEICCQYSIEP